MTLLATHIILSLIALGSNVWLFTLSRLSKTRQAQAKLILAGTFTLLSITSGVLMLFRGGSVARTCIAGGLLITTNVGLIIYSRKLSPVRIKV